MTSEVVVPIAVALRPSVPLQLEISVQFLVGVAGTILLMLLFLMVVVLWDVALALRDVAEKIDYLEDDVDSDLSSINGTLTRIYDRMGSSGAPGGEGVPAAPTGVDATGRDGVAASAGPTTAADVRSAGAKPQAAGVNAAAGGTATVTPNARGAPEQRATAGNGRRPVGTAPTAGTTEQPDGSADVDGEHAPNATDSTTGRVDTADSTTGRVDTADSTTGRVDTADSTTGGVDTTDSTTGGVDTTDSTTGSIDADDATASPATSERDQTADAGASTPTEETSDGSGVNDDDLAGTTEPSATGDEDGPSATGDEDGPSADATTQNVGRFASDGSGDSAWYDVKMDVPAAKRPDADGASEVDEAGNGTEDETMRVEDRFTSDEVQDRYVDPVSAFGNANAEDESAQSTVSVDDLGSRIQGASADAESEEAPSDADAPDDGASGADAPEDGSSESDANRDDDEEAVVDDGAVADAETDATADPGTEVVDVTTRPSRMNEDATDEADALDGDTVALDDQGTADDDFDDDALDQANADALEELDEQDRNDDENAGAVENAENTEDAEDADGAEEDVEATEPASAGRGDADAIVEDLAAAKERIRERHEDDDGTLDYTSLQQEAAATPGVKGSGMPAEEMLDALAAASVHELDDGEGNREDVSGPDQQQRGDSGDDANADRDGIVDALAERREESDAVDGQEADASDELEVEADESDDGDIASLVNRELDTLTQEVGGTSMTPDVSDADLNGAIDELDGHSYTFPLSGESFDVTASTDAETATLSFTSGDGMDLGGARERLLTYQLRNYLDRDDTAHAELSVTDTAVVLEIPAANGPAVDAWADAAVQIIDRTLYLSKDEE